MEEISSQSNISRILGGDKRSIARAISAVESGQPKSTEMLKALFPHTGRAVVIGITGAPGAGKSTLVDGLASYYRAHDQRVGVIAVASRVMPPGGAALIAPWRSPGVNTELKRPKLTWFAASMAGLPGTRATVSVGPP